MASSTTSASPTGLPAGISTPLETVSRLDQGGLVAILTAFGLALIFVSFPIRTYVRNKLGRYKMDDYAFISSSIFAVLQAAAVFYELRQGLGKSEALLGPNEILLMEKAAYASDILYIVTMFLSKCATAFLFLRLTPGRAHTIAIWGTISTCIVWAIVSIFLIALRCHPSHPWTDVSSECTGLFARWQFVAALDIATEAALFMISIYIVWAVQMSLSSKSLVVGAFGSRLPVIALAGLRLHFLRVEIYSSNITLLSTNSVTCTQLQIGYSIMASIVPCLKTFMMPYERQVDGPTQYHNYASGNGGSHKLSSLASNSRDDGTVIERVSGEEAPQSTGRGRLGTKFAGKLRPEQTLYEAKVVGQGDRDGRKSVDSGNSRRMIIKKGVEWSVDYDGRTASPVSKEEDLHTLEEAA